MDEVLEVSTRPYDPRRPLVCLDETSKQLLRDARAGQSPAPGPPARVDYEYDREGVVNLFVCCEPLAGRRWVEVTAQRTRRDWAQQKPSGWPRSCSSTLRRSMALGSTSRRSNSACWHANVSTAATLAHEVTAWQQRRNASASPVDWRFTTADARIKLKRLYPSLQE